MILRLLLIFYLLSLGSPVLAQKINLALCDGKAACFIRKSCRKSSTGATDNTILVQKAAEELNNDDCDVIIQARAFSETKFHIMVQVKSPVDKISPAGVSLLQGPNNEMQFQCTKEAVSPGDLLKFKTESILREIDDHLLFCSFNLFTVDLEKTIVQLFKNTYKPSIIFNNGTEHTITFEAPGAEFWKKIDGVTVCDPGRIVSADSKNSSHIFEKVDSSSTQIKCDSVGILQIIKEDKTENHAEALECNESKEWAYDIRNGNRKETITMSVNTEEKITVSCVYMVCALCKPLEYFNCGSGCEKMTTTIGSSRQCAANTCANNLWRVDREIARNGTIECRPREGSANRRDSIWYLIPFDPSAKKEEVSTAACAINANCREDSGVKFNCPRVNDVPIGCQTELYAENNDVTCPNETQLTIQSGKGEPFYSSYLTCDIITGRYKDNKSAEIDQDSNVYCLQSERPPGAASSAGMSDNIIKVGVVVLAVIIFILLPIGFLVHYLKNRKKPLFVSKSHSDENKKKAEMEALRREANPTRPVNRRNLAWEDKTKWERRTYRWQQCVEIPPHDEISIWDDDKFCFRIAYEFVKYSREVKLEVLSKLTTMDAYNMESKKYQEDYDWNKPDPLRVKPGQFGTLKQFFWLWKACAELMMDDWVAWEYMWHYLRMLYEGFELYDDDREMCLRIITIVTDWARAMLNEFSYKRRQQEDQCDTWLRFLAVRMLLWANVPDVVREMTRLANLPWGTLESPMRAIVFAHSCRNMERAEEFKQRHWADIQLDEQIGDSEELDRFGTKRQHLLYGLCSSRDETKKGFEGEFKMLKEIFTAIWDYSKLNEPTESYTPRDQLWALRGVAEFVTNMSPAVDHLGAILQNLSDFEGTMDTFLGWRSKAAGVEIEALKEEWIADFEKIICLAGECCKAKHQFSYLAAGLEQVAQYCVRPNPEDPSGRTLLRPWFPVKEYIDRPFNLANLLAHNKVTDYMYEAVYFKTPGVVKAAHKRHVQNRAGKGGSPFTQRILEEKPVLEEKIKDLQKKMPEMKKEQAKIVADKRKREQEERAKELAEEKEWLEVHGFGENLERLCGPCEECRERDENKRVTMARLYEEHCAGLEKQFKPLPAAAREAKEWEYKVGRYREHSARSPDLEDKTAPSDRSPPDLEEKTARPE